MASTSSRIINDVVMSSKINWNKFKSLLPSSCDIPYFVALKAKNDVYLKKVNSLPPSLPIINFDDYRNRVSQNDAAKIDHLKKLYDAVNVPYPEVPANIFTEIEQRSKEAKNVAIEKIKELVRVKAELDVERKKFVNFPPRDEWNPEMWMYYFGDDACPNYSKLKTNPEREFNRLLQATFESL